jgi:hypothetical protein
VRQTCASRAEKKRTHRPFGSCCSVLDDVSYIQAEYYRETQLHRIGQNSVRRGWPTSSACFLTLVHSDARLQSFSSRQITVRAARVECDRMTFDKLWYGRSSCLPEHGAGSACSIVVPVADCDLPRASRIPSLWAQRLSLMQTPRVAAFCDMIAKEQCQINSTVSIAARMIPRFEANQPLRKVRNILFSYLQRDSYIATNRTYTNGDPEGDHRRFQG